jgi:hypothetical protein
MTATAEAQRRGGSAEKSNNRKELLIWFSFASLCASAPLRLSVLIFAPLGVLGGLAVTFFCVFSMPLW